MIRTNTKKLFLASALILGFSNANGQVRVIDKNASPLEVTTSAIYNDNLNPTLDTEYSATGVRVAPRGSLVAVSEGAWFVADYHANLEYYRLSDDPVLIEDDQDFNGYGASLMSRLFLSKAWHLDAQAGYARRTEYFGEGISQLRLDVLEADERDRAEGALTLVYGNDTSERFVAVKVSTQQDSYADNNEYSERFDVSRNALEVNLAFRQSSVTRWLVRLEGIDEDFDDPTREDSKVYRALLGADWRPTGKSRLEVLVGMFERDFDTQGSSSGLSWSIDYTNRPSDHWSVELSSARFTDTSANEFTSDSIKQTAGVDIRYLFSEQWWSGVMVNYENTEFEETTGTRDLDRTYAFFQLGAKLKEHSELRLNVGSRDVSMSDDLVDYTQNEVRLSWHVSL